MENTKPIIAFVHIGKTAGSTINSYLQKKEGSTGVAHVEAWINNDAWLLKNLKILDWVSGHVAFPAMRARLASFTARPIHFFTVMRDPHKQLMSHYNWLIEIRHRGESFFNNHPDSIKKISDSIEGADNADPQAVISQIKKYPGLFLNIQMRTVFGEASKKVSANSFQDRLSVYTAIGHEGNFGQFVANISGENYSEQIMENQSGYHFPKEVFETNELVSFAEEHNSLDIALYKYVTENWK